MLPPYAPSLPTGGRIAAAVRVFVSDPEMTVADQFHRMGLERQLLSNGRSIRVRLANRPTINATALVGTRMGDIRNRTGGLDEDRFRTVGLFGRGTFDDGTETTLSFHTGNEILLTDEGTEQSWIIEDVPRQLACGWWQFTVTRVEAVSTAGTTNRDGGRYSAGGRLRRRAR